MGQDLITYEDKVALDENPDIADINKVKDTDMNQIKNVINGINNGSQPLNNLVVGNIESKNKFNVGNPNIVSGYINKNTNKFLTDGATKSIYIPCETNTTYTISKMQSARFTVAYSSVIPSNNSDTRGAIENNSAASITITTDSNANYLIMYMFNSSYDTTITLSNMLKSIQIEEGDIATPYTEHIAFNNNPYVLWANPSPTSSFAGQTITLNDNISNYNYYEIIYRQTSGVGIYYSTGKIPSGQVCKMMIFAATMYTRTLQDISGTSCQVGNCSNYTTYGSSTSTNVNDACVPYQILGYK